MQAIIKPRITAISRQRLTLHIKLVNSHHRQVLNDCLFQDWKWSIGGVEWIFDWHLRQLLKTCVFYMRKICVTVFAIFFLNVLYFQKTLSSFSSWFLLGVNFHTIEQFSHHQSPPLELSLNCELYIKRSVNLPEIPK